MIAYVAQGNQKGFTVKRMVDVGCGIGFHTTDCRSFSTFDEASKAARFMAKRDNVKFVNMR